LLQALILLRRERSGQITRLRREVYATNEIGPKGLAVGGQLLSLLILQAIREGAGRHGRLMD